jgi:hypothetical protein
MVRKLVTLMISLISATAMAAEEPVATATMAAVTADSKPQAEKAKSDSGADKDAKSLSGMSILGNQDAPKALVIVPWKSSQLGDTLGISKTLDDGRQPVDKEVFMRQLSYYEIRANSK